MPRIPHILHAQALVILALSASSEQDALEVCLDETRCIQEDGLSLLQVGARQLSANAQTSSAVTSSQVAENLLSHSSRSLQGNAPDDARPQTEWDCCGNVAEEATRNLYFFCEGPLVRPTPETHSYMSDGIAPVAQLMCGTSLDSMTYPMKYMLLKLPDILNYCEEEKMSVSSMVTVPVRMTDSDFFKSEVWYNTPMVAECSFAKLSMLQMNVYRDSGMTNPGAAVTIQDSLLQTPVGLLPQNLGTAYQMVPGDHVTRTLTFFCEGPVVLSTPETMSHESFGPTPIGKFMCGTELTRLTHPMTYLFVHLPGGFACETGTMVMQAKVSIPAAKTDDEFFASKTWRKMALIPRCSFYDFTQGLVSFETHGVFNPGAAFA